MPFGDRSVAADCVILVSDPYNQDDVERSGCVVKELRHYSLHTCQQKKFCVNVAIILHYFKGLGSHAYESKTRLFFITPECKSKVQSKRVGTGCSVEIITVPTTSTL